MLCRGVFWFIFASVTRRCRLVSFLLTATPPGCFVVGTFDKTHSRTSAGASAFFSMLYKIMWKIVRFLFRFLVSFFVRFLARFFDKFLCWFLCRFFLKVDMFDCDQSSVGNRKQAAAAQCHISSHRSWQCRVDDKILQVHLQSLHVIHFDKVSSIKINFESKSRLCCYSRGPHILCKSYPHLCPRSVSPGHEKVGRRAPFWISPWQQAQPAFHVVLERCWRGAKQTNLRVSS